MWAERAEGVGLLVQRPQEIAFLQVAVWGQCAPPRMVARSEEEVDNQNNPFWSAHIACRPAVSRRILSSAVCTGL